MRKLFIVLLCLGAFTLQFCSSSKKAMMTPPKVTFAKDVLPIVNMSCSPCHISGKGNKTPYNDYAKAKGGIDEIMERINKNSGDRGFMPKNHAKLPDSTIQVFARWKQDGLME